MTNESQPVSPINKLTEAKTIISFVVAVFVLYMLFSSIEFDTIVGVITQPYQLYYISCCDIL